MTQILFFLLVVIFLVVIFLVIKNKFKNESSLEKINREKQENKQLAKNRILELFKIQGKIQNRDVENLLLVSDATATNYLDELEKEGKIIQKGETGRGVFYTQING